MTWGLTAVLWRRTAERSRGYLTREGSVRWLCLLASVLGPTCSGFEFSQTHSIESGSRVLGAEKSNTLRVLRLPPSDTVHVASI
jgi:hypothetical protein